MMKKITSIIIHILAITLCASFANAASEGNTRELREKCLLECNRFNYQEVYHTAGKLLVKSKASGDMLNEGYARFFQGISSLFMGKSAEGLRGLKRALTIGEKLSNDSLLAYVNNSLAVYEVSANLNHYVAQRYFLKSLDHSKKAGLESLQCGIFGNLAELAYMQKDTLGIKYAQECYDIGKKTGNSQGRYVGALHLAEMYHLTGLDPQARHYLDEALNLAGKHNYPDVAHAQALYSSILLNEGKGLQALEYADKAIVEANKSLPMVLPEAYFRKANALARLGRYADSNRALSAAINECTRNKVYTEIVEIYELMSENYERLGELENALQCSRKAKESSDSLIKIDKEHLSRERKLVLDITRKEQEAQLSQQRLRETRRLAIALGGIVFLLSALLYLYYAYSKKKNRLYDNIVRQNTQAIAREEELKSRNRDLAEKLEAALSKVPVSTEDTTPSVAPGETEFPRKIDEEKSNKIFEALEELMEKEKIYADTQLNRDTLAKRLGTNKTYLTRIIQEHGMSLPQYLNSYRIREAIKILSDIPGSDMSLKDLSLSLGFGSVSNFYKLFQEQVGMSPAAYRKHCLRQ